MAQLTWLQAESSRNREARPEPFQQSDFHVWGDVAERPRPPSDAGAALLELLRRDLLPAFALNGPWLADLEAQGRNSALPPRLCWAAEDAILLAPYRVDRGQWGGFLVALRSAAGQVREFASEAGAVLQLRVPADIVPGRAFAAARARAVLVQIGRENCE